MNAKQLLMVSALVAVAMTTACSDKQDTVSDNAASAPAATVTTNSQEAPAASPAANAPGQAEQVNAQQSAQSPTPDADGLVRVHFEDVFSVTADGSFSPKVPVDINGVQMGPGVTFGGGVQFGGFALSQAAGHDLGVRRLPNGFVQLVKYYS